jgi:hypothetical protein
MRRHAGKKLLSLAQAEGPGRTRRGDFVNDVDEMRDLGGEPRACAGRPDL